MAGPCYIVAIRGQKGFPGIRFGGSKSKKNMISTFLDLTVRIGCQLDYEATVPTAALFMLRPRVDDSHLVTAEQFTVSPGLVRQEFQDAHGNTTRRAMLVAGHNTVAHDALVSVSSQYEERLSGQAAVPVSDIPPELLRYTLPSRYCDSDKLLEFAWDHFGQINNGSERVVAICDWIHTNIQYRFGSGRPDLSASNIIERRYGVCRDFAHTVIALCRTFNIPARYVTGHLPDIGFNDSGHPGDFHAYCEVYLAHKWWTVDARFNTPRIGRIKMSHGLDAVDGAFGTIFGEANMTYFEVWSYQVNPGEVMLGSPRDMSKRLDGTPLIRFS
jgi:transglutaminase-like putative cysteine protease